MKTTILFAVLLAFLSTTEAEIGMGVLMIWPTARSTALAGAMTGLADEADATFFNPAGLAFQITAMANLDYGNWLPGLYQGMCYASAAGGAPVRLPFLGGRNAFIAGSLTYLTTREIDIVNEQGEFLGRTSAWRGSASVQAAAAVADKLSIGIAAKFLISRFESWNDDYLWWPWFWPFGDPVLGLESGGDATTVAADLALLYRPASRFSIGAAIVNLGPHIVYQPSGEDAELPRMARLGVCWTPVESRYVRLRVMPELTKVLVGMFSDTTGKSFGRQLHEEWHDVWKAVGIEATAFGLVSLRLAYFEDLTYQRGGITMEKGYRTYHYGIWDILARKHLGRFERIGLCWGFGLGTDKLRFDVSSDAAMYDFPTSNWKLSLVANDIAGGIRELKQGLKPWEE